MYPVIVAKQHHFFRWGYVCWECISDFLLILGVWYMMSPSPNFEMVVSDPLSASISNDIDSSNCIVDGLGPRG